MIEHETCVCEHSLSEHIDDNCELCNCTEFVCLECNFKL